MLASAVTLWAKRLLGVLQLGTESIEQLEEKEEQLKVISARPGHAAFAMLEDGFLMWLKPYLSLYIGQSTLLADHIAPLACLLACLCQ